MRKIYRKLSEDQIARGVIFSSSLSNSTVYDGETVHEVREDTLNKDKVIERLKDDKFFNNGPWKYNIIRTK